MSSPSVVEQFTPKMVTVLREGYGLSDLKADALAGLTVAIVALPLSMAIAIASGVGPERGLYTAIVGGFLVSALGGSRFQIGGPAGAFIVLVAACVAEIGLPGLATATLLAGLFLAVAGFARIGTYVKYIPYPVTVGFTAGIGIIIFMSQVRDLGGLTLAGPEPGAIIPKSRMLWDAAGTLDPATLGVSIGTIAVILVLRKFRPHWPGLLIAVTLGAVAAWAAHLPVATIGSRFGELPRGLPLPLLPDLSAEMLRKALPYAASFTLLGAIESLLSAVVADGMSGRRHRSNAELVAQGIANIGSAIFGGIVVTGTIARTATNVRAGSHGPVSGMLHSLFVLLVMLVAAPLASYIPLASLAGVLALVSWNMIERDAMWMLIRTSFGDALVLLVTLALVVFRDLSEGIVVGFLLGSVLFIKRMSDAAEVREGTSLVPGDQADTIDKYLPKSGTTDDVVVYRIKGALFFGAAATVGGVLDRIAEHPRAIVVDFSEVPFLDSTGARSIELLGHKVARSGGRLILTGLTDEMRRQLMPLVQGQAVLAYPDIAAAMRDLRAAATPVPGSGPDAQAVG